MFILGMFRHVSSSSYFIKVLMNNSAAYSSWLLDIVKKKYLNLPHLSVGICILDFKGHCRVG